MASIEAADAAAGSGCAWEASDRHRRSTGLRRLVVVALLLVGSALAFGCASSRVGQGRGATDSPPIEHWGKVDRQDLEYAERVGPFSLIDVEDFEEVELGVRLKYVDSRFPRAAIDAYVYPIAKIETLSLTRVLEWEMNSVSNGMKLVAQQNGLKAGEGREFPFGPSSAAAPPGLGALRILASRDQEWLSLAYLVVRDHRFFKLRMTIPRDDLGATGEEYFREVVDVLAPAIRLRPPVEMPVFGVTVYRNVFSAPQNQSCNVAGWAAYGIVLMREIEAGHYLDSFARELAARKGALELWQKMRKEGKPCASDVLEAMSRAEEAGFLDEYVFERLGRPTWTAPDDLQLEAWKRWSEANLAEHDPVVEPGIAVEWHEAKDGKPGSTPRSAPSNR